MNKCYFIIISALLFLYAFDTNSATWEKLYSKANTDCFRNVKEVPSGGYIAAGYTSNFTSNDTDALVMRFNTNGDTLWTLKYNGPSSKEDCFYKVVPTADGGFVLCGYSKSFGGGDNAFFMKINSSGSIQWVDDWGGSGIERAQDIIELPNGKFVLCGYTTSSPAQYYDAFIMKIDQNGNSVWNKRYGTSNYDDANSIKLLPDDGFILGGQSNNQLYLIRTDSNGDSLWTRKFGTSGIDNIECIAIAQGGDGFILAGGTNGTGAGGDDGYIVKTDTDGIEIWAKTFGGSLNDDFHRIEPTSDGGYIASGTSSTGAWSNPNIWLNKIDVNGNSNWSKVYGGDHHDHGYGGQQTSDGGYIVGGHTRSYGPAEEDGIIIKTNSSGSVSNELSYTTVKTLISPVNGGCGNATAQVQVEIANYGQQTVSNIPVTIEITGAITQTLTQTYTSSIDWEEVKTMTFTTTINMSSGGTYNFHCFTGSTHDVYPAHNYLDKSITVNVTSSPPSVTNGTHCGPAPVTISASSPDPIKWYAAATGGSSLSTSSSFTTPYITSTTTYYAQAGQSCPSTRVAVNASITAGLAVPTGSDVSRCGNGTVTLTGNSSYPIKWYDTGTSSTVLFTGSSFTTPSLSANGTYYIAAENASCTSTRVALHVTINALPADPVTTPGTICGSGTVNLSATSSHTLMWFNVANGGSQLGSGNTFTTPTISATTTYFAQADDGTCFSNRVPVIATINTVPTVPSVTSADRCGNGTLVLAATAADLIKWYDVATGGSSISTGNSFTTPSLSVTTIYYALTDNGLCKSIRVPVNANVYSIPASPVTTSDERCGDGTLLLNATAPDPVLWYDAAVGGNQVGNGNSFSTPVITTTTTYYAQADNGHCTSGYIAAIATINILPSVNFGTDTIYSTGSSYLLDAGAGFSSYYWSATETSQTFTAQLSGNYCVTLTDANGCSGTSCVYVELPTGVQDLTGVNTFSLYPDPSNGIITLQFKNIQTKINFSVIDITGKLVYSHALISEKETLDLSFLRQGIYIVKLNDEKTSSSHRLIIEK